MFAFDEEQALSEHTAPFDALVQMLEGEMEISIDRKPLSVKTGNVVLMPANLEIEDLGVQFWFGNVEQADVLADSPNHAGIGNGRPDDPCADDPDLLFMFSLHLKSRRVQH